MPSQTFTADTYLTTGSSSSIVSVATVRARSGGDTNLISDSQVQTLIDNVEKEVERWLNCKLTPTERIDILDGEGNNYVFAEKNPLLQLLEVKNDSDALTLSDLDVYPSSGKISFKWNASTDSTLGWFPRKPRSIKVRYIHGWFTRQDTVTTTTSAATAGDFATFSVKTVTGLSVGDYIDISGMDGNREIAEITRIDNSTLTVDSLSFDHESDSVVTLMDIPQVIKSFMEYESAIAVAVNAIGSTYTFNAGYNLGEMSVQKGVPHTHWQASFEKLVKQRDLLASKLKPRPAIMN